MLLPLPTLLHRALSSGPNVFGFLLKRVGKRVWAEEKVQLWCTNMARCSGVRTAIQTLSLLEPKWLGLCPLLGWILCLCISASFSHPSGCSEMGVIDPTLFLQSLDVKLRIIISICREKKGELWEPKWFSQSHTAGKCWSLNPVLWPQSPWKQGRAEQDSMGVVRCQN